MFYKMSIGGAETFVYNILSVIDTEKYQIDICIQGKDVTNKKLYRLCRRKGCRIYVIPAFDRNYPAYMMAVEKILRLDHYDIVHIHMNALINCVPVFIALHHADKVVVHSHNTQNNMGGRIGLMLHCFNRRILQNKNLIRAACGEDAGKWMFGERTYTILDNAISIPKFSYNKNNREIVRKELGIEGKKVIGHVGRFVEAKNHEFLLDIFTEYVKQEAGYASRQDVGLIAEGCDYSDQKDYGDTVLVMIGDGELLETIKKKAQGLAIEDRIVFAGNKMDVAKYYSAFDCLLFPSKFEGLPFVLVEAQTNGLSVVASDKVTTEMDLVGNMAFVPLDAPMEEWMDAIKKALEVVDRLSYAEKMRRTKYNIENMIVKVEKLYDGE